MTDRCTVRESRHRRGADGERVRHREYIRTVLDNEGMPGAIAAATRLGYHERAARLLVASVLQEMHNER